MLGIQNSVFLFAFLVCTYCIATESYAGKTNPYWTEKSSYIEGDRLYVVGIATGARTKEQGRSLSFNNGKQEIMNFAQISNLDGLSIKTQMTHEEVKQGNYDVYRLMYVEYNELSSLKKNNIEQAKINYDNYQQKQEEEISIKRAALRNIKTNKNELSKLDMEYNKIINGVIDMSENALRYVKDGMSQSEVEKLLGKSRTNYKEYHNYGKYWVVYNRSGLVTCLSTTRACYSSICEDKSKCEYKGDIIYHNKMY